MSWERITQFLKQMMSFHSSLKIRGSNLDLIASLLLVLITISGGVLYVIDAPIWFSAYCDRTAVYYAFTILLCLISHKTRAFYWRMWWTLLAALSILNIYYASIDQWAGTFSSILILSLSAWIVYKWNDNNLNVPSSNPTSPGVYAVFYRPRNLFEYISSQFGLGVAGVNFYCVHAGSFRVENYYIDQKLKAVMRGDGANICRLFKRCLIVRISSNTLRFTTEANNIIGKKYHFTRSNCLTAFRLPLISIGIQLKTIFPSRFAKSLINGREF